MDFAGADGQPLPVAPRQVLQRVVARAESLGYTPFFSAEYEFFFFRETPESLRAKNFRNLTPLTPGMFGYSVLRASANSELVLQLLDQLAGFNCALEGFHTETGPGVYEAAIGADLAIAAADNAGLSPLMQQYIAGLVGNMPELAAVICPTINSYKRTVPGAWAPVNATWGIDNRTTAVRAIPGSNKSARVELRLSGADINPYLAMAASLAAGLDGIERKLQPPSPTVNAYAGGDGAPLPRNLA